MNEGNYNFHLVFGIVCQREKLWAKAREHLEKSINIKATPQAYVALAQIADQNDSEVNSTEIWKKAAQLNS